jgi:hypothetical protein
MREVGIAWLGEIRNAYRNLTWKPLGRQGDDRLTLRRNQEMGCEYMSTHGTHSDLGLMESFGISDVEPQILLPHNWLANYQCVVSGYMTRQH